MIRGKMVRTQGVLAAATACFAFSAAHAQFLSVDINGGNVTDLSGGQPVNACTNLGGQAHNPVGGFSWTAWGGQTNTGGDGTQLPMTGGGASGNFGGYPTLSMTRSFTSAGVASGAVTVVMDGTIAGANQNISFNSRDRGTPSGDTNFGDLYRDFVFFARNLSNGVGAGRVQFRVSGLDPGKTYNFTSFNFDATAGNAQVVYSNIDPQFYSYQDLGNGTFFSDPPEPILSSLIGRRNTYNTTSALTDPYQHSSTFKVTADASGNATFYEWCNNFSGQSQIPINGFQLGDVTSSTTWNGAGASGTWGTGPWSNGQANAVDTVANFGQTTGAQAITVDSPKTVGVLNLNNTNSYTFTGSSITIDAASAQQFTDAQATQSTGTFNGYGQINLIGAAAATVTHTIQSGVVLNDNVGVTVMPNNGNLLISGAVSGGASLNKLGNGQLTLTGNNTYSGTTNIHAGRLVVNGTHSGGGTYTIAGGAILGGTGNIHARVDEWNNGNIAPGSGGVGTLTMDELALGSHASPGGTVGFTIDVGAGSADKIAVTNDGGFHLADIDPNINPAGGTWNGTISITPVDAGGITAGTFPIVDYNGSMPDFTKFSLTTTTLGAFQLSLVNNTANTSIDLSVIGGTPNVATWTGTTDNNWTPNSNWSSNQSPNAVNATAVFTSPLASGQYNVNLDAAKTVGSMTISGDQPYTIGGAGLTFQADNQAPSLVVAGNTTHTISAPITLNNFWFITTAAGSTLNVTNTVNATAFGREISVSGGGTTQFRQLEIGTLLVNAGTTKISAKGTVGDPAGTTRIGTLTLGAAAKLDVTNNFVIVDNATAASIGSAIGTAFANGAWSGNGITSASAATIAGNSGNIHKTALGYGLASDVNDFGANPGFNFGGIAPNPTSILIRYTLTGDSNLDGAVTTADFTKLSQNFGGSSKNWVQGDFNYDGKVNALDFNAIATNFGATPAPGPVLSSLVPEPAALGSLATLALLARRRRRI